MLIVYVCYNSVMNLLFSRLLSKNMNTKTHKNIIFLWFCLGVEFGV
jgi:hypothetical protein